MGDGRGKRKAGSGKRDGVRGEERKGLRGKGEGSR